jgi:hypothetical protein
LHGPGDRRAAIEQHGRALNDGDPGHGVLLGWLTDSDLSLRVAKSRG